MTDAPNRNPYIADERLHAGDVLRDHNAVADLHDEHEAVVRLASLGLRRGQDNPTFHNFGPLTHLLRLAQAATHTVAKEVSGQINGYKLALDVAMGDHTMSMERYVRQLNAAGHELDRLRGWLDEAKAGPTSIERAGEAMRAAGGAS